MLSRSRNNCVMCMSVVVCILCRWKVCVCGRPLMGLCNIQKCTPVLSIRHAFFFFSHLISAFIHQAHVRHICSTCQCVKSNLQRAWCLCAGACHRMNYPLATLRSWRASSSKPYWTLLSQNLSLWPLPQVQGLVNAPVRDRFPQRDDRMSL